MKRMKRWAKWWFSPKVLLASAALNLLVWAAMVPIALLTGLGESLQYVTFISHYALILTALGWIQTALVDKKADERDPNT
jgi:hypothetical protein